MEDGGCGPKAGLDTGVKQRTTKPQGENLLRESKVFTFGKQKGETFRRVSEMYLQHCQCVRRHRNPLVVLGEVQQFLDVLRQL